MESQCLLSHRKQFLSFSSSNFFPCLPWPETLSHTEHSKVVNSFYSVGPWVIYLPFNLGSMNYFLYLMDLSDLPCQTQNPLKGHRGYKLRGSWVQMLAVQMLSHTQACSTHNTRPSQDSCFPATGYPSSLMWFLKIFNGCSTLFNFKFTWATDSEMRGERPNSLNEMQSV